MTSQAFVKVVVSTWSGADFSYCPSTMAFGGIATLWNSLSVCGKEILLNPNFYVVEFSTSNYN
jgi:hypothetical protein